MNLISVKNAITKFGLSKYVIYSSIKIDPTFPAINIGPKKNYKIYEDELKVWLLRKKEIHSLQINIPTTQEIIKRFQ